MQSSTDAMAPWQMMVMGMQMGAHFATQGRLQFAPAGQAPETPRQPPDQPTASSGGAGPSQQQAQGQGQQPWMGMPGMMGMPMMMPGMMGMGMPGMMGMPFGAPQQASQQQQ